MCGFAAAYSSSAPIPRPSMEKALGAIRHRGPDAYQIWASPDGRATLGHVRLSTVDIPTGHQPIANEDGSLQIVVNGEFYGYRRFQSELEARGHRLRTRSDSEIAMHLYEEHGPQCLHQLRGEFALVLWDAKNQVLFAARDRFGVKPLYYAFLGDTIFFASEIKALFAAGLAPRWDLEAVHDLHVSQMMLPQSLFEGVHEVPPGHYMLVRKGRQHTIRYWDLDYPEPDSPEIIRDPREAIEGFRAILDDAVRLRLEADVPVGCYLSGGLDSSGLLGVAAKFAPQPVTAFSLSFESEAYDEGAISAEMAAFAGADYRRFRLGARDLADHFADTVQHCEGPILNGQAVAKYLLSRFARDAGFKAVLTGEGADEILAGHLHFKRDLVLSDPRFSDPDERRRVLENLERKNQVSKGNLDGDESALAWLAQQLGSVPTIVASCARGGRGPLQPLRAEFRAAFQSRDPLRAWLDTVDIERQLRGRHPVDRAMYVWSRTFMASYLLTALGDRVEMAHSIEGRVPYLDHVLVEFCRRVPVSDKIRGLTEKYILREAVRPVVTETVYKRQKHPFLTPPANLFQDAALRELFNDTLRGPALDKVGFYDRALIEAMLDQMDDPARAGDVELDRALCYVTSVVILQERLGLSA
jgi:asparagine synthase (glutamine-hydrolysing)